VTRCLGFPPVSRADARVLVLGTLPGAESLRQGQYYANRHNAFWRIMAELTGVAPDAPYETRLESLRNVGVALWDVCAAARRAGSLDADIRETTPNDFTGFFRAHPCIELIGFNGQAAAKLFHRHVAPFLPAAAQKIPGVMLPSTSPAHASMSFERKRALWGEALMAP
jgi:double-stranded uracil-DNA glycosylase